MIVEEFLSKRIEEKRVTIRAMCDEIYQLKEKLKHYDLQKNLLRLSVNENYDQGQKLKRVKDLIEYIRERIHDPDVDKRLREWLKLNEL